ncbi:MAG: M20/M25/M40 family metallo-hydrolase [Clostridiales bacterium]|nr:M20/M25/M40 family metallo-hydrolase [Clostridiales bacterium]
MTIVWLILILLVAFIAVIIAHALKFTPEQKASVPAVDFPVDIESVTEHFQQMIRLKTVSGMDESLVDQEEFIKFQNLLPTLYPTIYATCEYERIGLHGILIRWAGKHSNEPSVFMAHYDVVPVNQAEWDEPAFEGLIKDGELWGRGTLDTKGTLLGIMEAAESLLKQGFVPENDIYFAFGGDEETVSTDAPAIVDELERRGIKPALVLDEGGAIVEGVFPGVKQSAAVIGIAEKGSVYMDLSVQGAGGHASAPPPQQAVAILANALAKLQRNAMPFALTKPAKELFDTMGRHSTFAYKIIFANLWCFAPVINLICKMSGGELNALVRTTCALTKLSASDSYNVLPTSCKAGINLRIICGETVESVTARLKAIIGDDRVTIKHVEGGGPSAISRTIGDGWDRLTTAINQAYPEALVSPYLMVACSDSRHYCRISENVYRFSGMPLTKAQRGMIHNANERIPLNLLDDVVTFFACVMKQC